MILSSKFAPKPNETLKQKTKRIQAMIRQLIKKNAAYDAAKAKIDAQARQLAQERRNIVINR